jgi:ArsR family transcriptional regulator
MVRTVTLGTTTSTGACCAPLTDEPMTTADAQEFAGVLAALADPIRLRLFSLLAAAGELCSCDLEGPLERSQPTISHHTKILAEAGLIRGTKRGKWMYWSVDENRLTSLRHVLGEE